jgi:TolB-like protein/class 3 adenylate cyclase/tetratricopeptide (TPR) repeat protein
MAAEVKKEIVLEIAHVLFIDIVGYSKLSINEQHAAVEELNEVVRASEQFQKAETSSRLLKIATGDGMALVFYTSPEAPAQCALEISRALKEHPRLQLRMGIHSGPVSGVVDVNNRPNLAGAGLNMAQRVMDCGDAGHILLSKHVAEDLEEYEQWRPLLHDLGICEVKHGVRVTVVNLYADHAGNPQLPKKYQALKKHRSRVRWAEVAVALLLLAAIIGALIFALRRPPRPTLSIAEKSIAVLPFENLSEERANAFFADGVQDEILTNLAKIADLKVISRTSVMQYTAGARNVREIGQQLGVAHVLEGSVQRAGGKVRVTAQLIDTRTDVHQWAEHYDRPLGDVFAIQSEIAKTIAGQLQLSFPRMKKPRSRGHLPTTSRLSIFTRGARRCSSAPFSVFGSKSISPRLWNFLIKPPRAIQNFSWPTASWPPPMISFIFSARTTRRPAWLWATRPSNRRCNCGRTRLKRTLLSRNISTVVISIMITRVSEIAIAQRALPNDPLRFELTGYIDRRQGHWEESTRNLELALERDPRNVYTLQQISASYYFLHRYEEMAGVLERALAIIPKDVNTRIVRAVVDLDWHADTKPLRATIEAILAEDPAAGGAAFADSWLTLALCEHDPVAGARALTALAGNNFGVDAILLSPTFGEGLVARLRGDLAAAQSAFATARIQQEKWVRAQPEYGPPLCVLGLIDAALGRKEEALGEGRRAIELLPSARDSVNGAPMIEFFAIICAWVGEKDLALQQLKIATESPGTLSYGQLKLHPFWDPIRGDPRFEKIVANLAPK